MNSTEELRKLPEKVRNNLPLEAISGCIAVIKTTYKPNPNTPTVWLIMHHGGFMCCSSNKNSCVYKRLSVGDIDSIRIVKGNQLSSSRIEFIYKDMDLNDFMVTVPHDTNFSAISHIFKANGYQVI